MSYISVFFHPEETHNEMIDIVKFLITCAAHVTIKQIQIMTGGIRLPEQSHKLAFQFDIYLV